MKIGKTESALNAEIERRGALFAVLLDPDASDDSALLKAGILAAENGADVLFVGGSFMGNFKLPAQVAALKPRSNCRLFFSPAVQVRWFRALMPFFSRRS
jgi:putative glycerol-1-phosphate prenyltransferase/phosphoglycerol geranylgeranyltransferase